MQTSGLLAWFWPSGAGLYKRYLGCIRVHREGQGSVTESGGCKFYYHCNTCLGPINLMNIYRPHFYTVEYYFRMGNGWVTSQVLNEME